MRRASIWPESPIPSIWWDSETPIEVFPTVEVELDPPIPKQFRRADFHIRRRTYCFVHWNKEVFRLSGQYERHAEMTIGAREPDDQSQGRRIPGRLYFPIPRIE